MHENTESTVIPDDLTALSTEELTALLDSARDEAATLRDIPAADLTDEQLSRLEALGEFAEAHVAETTRRDTEAAEREQRAAAAAERFDAATTTGEGGDEEGDDAPEGDEEGDEAAEDEPVVVDQPQSVAAAAQRSSRPARVPARRQAAATARRQPARRDSSMFSMVAAAGVRDVSPGQVLETFDAVAEAFIAAAGAFPGGPASERGLYQRLGVAKIRRDFSATADGLFLDNPDYRGSVLDLVASAGQESRLSGGSLVAAGGWCAPSETLYGFASNETLDGMWDTPTIGMARGGVNYTPGPDFQDIYTSAGFAQTEAQAIAGETKACVEVDCPDFAEVRLDAVGICVKAPLLTRAAYNELVTAWIRATVVANAHKVNARRIAAARTALGTALAPTLTGTPVTWGALTALELIGEGQRQAYRLGEGQTLEVVAPRWLRVAIRADLANRNGIDERSVSNAQIAQHFADRGLMIQWVLGYQELSSPTTNVAFPTPVELMIYPAGTFVTGEKSIISLDTVYDTADLQTNVYTAAFVEDGVALFKQNHGGKRLNVPVNVSGLLGAAQMDDSWGSAQVESLGV